MKKTVGLVILDGMGYSERTEYNAVKNANTPFLDSLFENYSHTLLQASGQAVGLLDGQMGNSEVGHLNLGAGRVVRQDLTRITNSINDGSFYQNVVLLNAMKNAKSKNKNLHLFGLVSTGGVHSHLSHLFALLKMAKDNGLEKVYVHCFTDGRDTPTNSAKDFVSQIQQKIDELGVGKIATVIGRYYVMDREKNYERTNLAYDCLVYGKGAQETNAISAIENSYSVGVTDEFIKPISIVENGKPVALIQDGDYIIFYNYRADRARQICEALTDKDFAGFKRSKITPTIVTFTEYKSSYPFDIAFKPEDVSNTFSDYLSSLNMTQLKMAETTKYAHITYFFNGGKEALLSGEDRILIEGKKVATFDLAPEMSSDEIATRFTQECKKDKYDFFLINLANCDMVGHTGNYEACLKAVEAVDKALKKIVDHVQSIGGEVVVTADHGNADDEDPNSVFKTTHTLNPVPLVVVSKNKPTLKKGKLCDVAPTLLKLLGLEQPKEMTGESLF